MSRGHSLRGRLLGAMLLIFAAGLLASFISYGLEVNKRVSDLQASTLQQQARALLDGVTLESDGSVRLQVPAPWQEAYADRSGRFAYTLYDPGERAVAVSPNLTAPLAYVPLPGGESYAPIRFAASGAGERAVLAARAPRDYVLVVAHRGIGRKPLVDSLFEEASEQLLVLWPFAALALILTWAITWWSLRPVTRASREAASVGPADLEQRISTRGLPREIRPLVDAVNSALDRLAAAYSAERQITADAAHELRTPLSVLSLRLQRARSAGAVDWPAVEHDINKMTQVVSQLLDLARKEAQPQDFAALPAINLSRVIREAAAMVLPLLESQGRPLELNVPDALPMRGHADHLRDLVRNLLENAVSHGRGTVTVVARHDASTREAGTVIEVADEGEGVPLGQEEEVFQRFRKLDANSPGAGLGLAIVRQVARSHGGDVRFLRGRGHVVVHFPDSGGGGRAPTEA